MNYSAILRWFQQPSSVGGLSAIVGTLAGVASGQLTWAQAVPYLVGGAIAIALPDNTAAKASAVLLAQDFMALSGGDKAAISKAVTDGAALASELFAKK